jgi:DNA-binding beta-propeller fold protein YncE
LESNGRRPPFQRSTKFSPRAVGLAVVAVVAASVLAGVLYTVLAPRERIQVAANSLAVFDPDNGEPTADIAVGVNPMAVSVAAGSAWVANTDDKTITRLNVSRYELQRTIPLDVYPSAVAPASEGVWVVSGPDAKVFRLGIDNRASKPIRLGYTCRKHAAVATGAGLVWVVCDVAPGSFSFDPKAHPAQASILIFAKGFSAAAFGAGGLWLADANRGLVLEVDPVTNRIRERVRVGGRPVALAVGAGSVWVASSRAGTVSRIEQARVVATLAVGKAPGAVVADEKSVWVANQDDRSISRIDPRTNRLSTVKLSNTPVGLALGAGRLWVTIQPR